MLPTTLSTRVDIPWIASYRIHMFEIEETDDYKAWFAGLKDIRAKAKILARVRNMSQGNFSDVEPVGNGVSETKIHYGPGYRVYFKKTGNTVVLLLCGGDKSSQSRDIKAAKALAAEV